MLNKKALAATAAAAEPVYVEDVFSTWLLNSTGSDQTVINGIDLANEGGMVWFKTRDAIKNNYLYDTLRGVNKEISSNSTAAEYTLEGSTNQVKAFNNNGFTVGSDPFGGGTTAVSWTFRKAEKFFDVVTYTGNGSNRTISHNLGSVPGSIFIKRTDTTGAWAVYHRSLANTEYLVLNTTAAKATGATYWNSTTPTSTVFSLGTATDVNANNGTYVAYLFAHDAGGFGDDGDQNVISCGSFTTDGSGGFSVNLGYEPQWVMIKTSSTTSGWFLLDNMRGFAATGINGTDQRLYANTSGAEAGDGVAYPTATGFAATTSLASSSTCIYIAIRRWPMKTPESGTSVFSPVAYTGTNAAKTITANFAPDLSVIKTRGTNVDTWSGAVFVDKLRGQTKQLSSANTTAELTNSTTTGVTAFTNTGITIASDTNYYQNLNNDTYVDWLFRRAPGFFDVVCYTGTGSNRTVTHNLGVAPELMIIKTRDQANDPGWPVYSSALGNTQVVFLDKTNAATTDTYWNNTTPTSTVFSLGDKASVNNSTKFYIAYLFASVTGVSKVGSYTGTGTTLQINCGFTNGARFVLIKRTSTGGGDWYVWDSARGIVSGNDPYLLLNSTAAEVTNTDYIDTYNSGFEISSTAPAAINANGGTFIYLAIA